MFPLVMIVLAVAAVLYYRRNAASTLDNASYYLRFAMLMVFAAVLAIAATISFVLSLDPRPAVWRLAAYLVAAVIAVVVAAKALARTND